MNKVILVGNLGSDVELRYTPGGAAVTTVSIATSEFSKDKSGERREITDWHRVVFWNRSAEILNEFCRKGSKILIEGRLKTRSWDDAGQKRFQTEVVADRLELLGSRSSSQVDDTAKSAVPASHSLDQEMPRDNFAAFDDDDIPF